MQRRCRCRCVGLITLTRNEIGRLFRRLTGASDRPARDLQHRLHLAHLEEHPEVGVVGCLTEALDEATGTRRPSSARTDGSWLDAAIVMVHPTMLVRQDLYARHGFYDDRYSDANDYEIQSRFASRGVRMHLLDERLFTYRVHPGSVTARRRRQVVGTSLRVSARMVLSYRRMLTARGWRSVARDAAIFVYLSLGLRHIVPPALSKRLWPPDAFAGRQG